MYFNVAVLTIVAFVLEPVAADWMFTYFRDQQCINFSGESAGDGNKGCENTGAESDTDAVEITGISGSGCIVTFYAGDNCQSGDNDDFEPFDEDENCAGLDFWPQTYDVTGCN